MGGYQVVYLTEVEKIKLRLDSIVIYKKGEELQFLLSDISMIVNDGLNTTISSRALSKISEYNIPFIICDEKHLPISTLVPLYGSARVSKYLKEQIKWTEKNMGNCWQKILIQKTTNQRLLLESIGGINFQDEIESLKKYEEEIVPHDYTSKEGVCAKIYFNCIFGKEFRRKRENPDITNIALNYGYSILRSYISNACVGQGLHTSLGIHHKSEYNELNLCDDLIEQFRPFVDYIVYKNQNTNKYLTVGFKRELINVLNGKVMYKKRKMVLSNVIDDYVRTVTSSMKTGDFEEMKVASIDTFEVDDDK